MVYSDGKLKKLEIRFGSLEPPVMCLYSFEKDEAKQEDGLVCSK